MVKIADNNRAETTFNVFHSLFSESINSSQLCLNRCNEGDTIAVDHSRSLGKKSIGSMADKSIVLCPCACRSGGADVGAGAGACDWAGACAWTCSKLFRLRSVRILLVLARLLASIIFCTSTRLSSASSNTLLTRVKYTLGSLSKKCRYTCRSIWSQHRCMVSRRWRSSSSLSRRRYGSLGSHGSPGDWVRKRGQKRRGDSEREREPERGEETPLISVLRERPGVRCGESWGTVPPAERGCFAS